MICRLCPRECGAQRTEQRGKKAAFNARFDETGRVVKEGAQVVLGANDKYIGLCRRHWIAGDLGPDFDIHTV